MQQPTSRQLYAYWDDLRNGRIAPRRFEVDPSRIASILHETFIAECTGLLEVRFRLAGTKICQQFGRELRGVDFLGLWPVADRDAMASLVRNVQTDGAVAHGMFHGFSRTHRKASFEFILMPLIHTDRTINRLLGSPSFISSGLMARPPSFRTLTPKSSVSAPGASASSKVGCRGGPTNARHSFWLADLAVT